MLRTVSIKLTPDGEQAEALAELREAFSDACNQLVPLVRKNRCWNRVALHRLAYYRIRECSPLGAQMVCNAIFAVCKAYRSQATLGKLTRDTLPAIRFDRASVHFDKRTYSLRTDTVSLNTLNGRLHVPMQLGEHQRALLQMGKAKEADVVFCRGKWFFNLVVESETPAVRSEGAALGVDVGENNLAATGTGKICGGGKLRYQRDRYLSLRRRLQSNGSESARQLLSKVSGRERRHVKHVNHETSKRIVQEAERIGASTIVLEDLTHIRSRIRAGRRIRSRLHRWAFQQLQAFVAYKAEAVGITVVYVNPAYSSQTCSGCGALGIRSKHRFSCSCGLRAHADVNAARNLARMGEAIAPPTAAVSQPNVADLLF